MKAHFDGQFEFQNKPMTVTIEEQLRRIAKMKEWLEDGNSEGSRGDPSKVHGVKRRSTLYDLPYWKVNSTLKTTSNSCLRMLELVLLVNGKKIA
jgi:hypothetical protein